MLAIKRTPRWPDPRVKPPYGSVGVDLRHPLSQSLTAAFLFNEGAGTISNLIPRPLVVTPYDTNGNPSRASWIVGPNGLAGNFTSGAGNLGNYLVPGISIGSGNASVCFTTIANTSGSLDAGSCGGTGVPQFAWGIDTSNWVVLLRTIAFIDSGLSPTNGEWYTVGISYTRGTGVTFVERSHKSGAIRVATIASASVPNSGGNFGSSIGSGDNLDRHWVQPISLTAMWQRALSADQLFELVNEPYAFLSPIIRRRYFVPAAGGNPWLHYRQQMVA